MQQTVKDHLGNGTKDQGLFRIWNKDQGSSVRIRRILGTENNIIKRTFYAVNITTVKPTSHASQSVSLVRG